MILAKRRLEAERESTAMAVMARQQRETILGKVPLGTAPPMAPPRHQSVLIIFNVTVENDPLQSWTFPAQSDLWEALQTVADPDLPADPTNPGRHTRVVVSASHSRKPLKMHPETFRAAIISQRTPHVVIDGNTAVDSRVFWATWAPRASRQQRTESSASVELMGAKDAAFPGELIGKLTLIPSSNAILRSQTNFRGL